MITRNLTVFQARNKVACGLGTHLKRDREYSLTLGGDLIRVGSNFYTEPGRVCYGGWSVI